MDFDVGGAFLEAFLRFWWVWMLVVLFAIGRLPWVKGWLGELVVRLILAFGLDGKSGRVVHNVTLETGDGTTQIDHVLISRFGIFVIETKNMRGWIFGDPRQTQWTQRIYRNSFRFQNPLRQNYRHQQALAYALGAKEEDTHDLARPCVQSKVRNLLSRVSALALPGGPLRRGSTAIGRVVPCRANRCGRSHRLGGGWRRRWHGRGARFQCAGSCRRRDRG